MTKKDILLSVTLN